MNKIHINMERKITMLSQRRWKIGFSVILWLSVFLFWGRFYPSHLSYQEQLQLFLFDTDYLIEHLIIPGGLAEYISEFLVQFYYHRWIGAAILATLFVVLQLLVWLLAQKHKAADVYYLLSFLPIISMWYFMTDENAMLAFAVSILFALGAMYLHVSLNSQWRRVLSVVLFAPLLYWFAGAAHFLFIGWAIICEAKLLYQNNKKLAIGGSIAALILMGLACPLISGLWLQYPIFRLMGGINFYRFPSYIPLTVFIVEALFLFFPFLISSLSPPKKNVHFAIILQSLVLIMSGYVLLSSGADMNKEEAMEYDWLVRNKEWQKIIEKAEAKSPTSPFGVTCLNLALGKTGQLGDRMFQFYQNGTEGLLPHFQRDFVSPLPTSEVFYYLGMINTAQRFTFEAMEAIPNYNKSGRCFKRLAETNLINGQYEVAAKYIRILRKTVFYKDWAEEAMTYLYNEKKISNHKEWGWLRKLRYADDFLFSDREIDMMLGLLYQHNYQNRMAFEYMLAYVLQERDLERFMKYYPLGKYAGYDHIPRSYQEALVYVWTQTHRNFDGMPWSISPDVAHEVTDFARIYMSQQNSQPILHTQYGDTFWYYLLFKKK